MTHTDTLRRFIEAVWNDGRAEAVHDFVAATYTIHRDPGDPWEGQALSPAELEERVRASRALAPDQRFEITEALEQGDRVCIAWDWDGTHLGEVGGIAPTGRRIAMTGLTIYYFDADGRITGHRQCADRLGVWQQISAGR